MGLSSTQRNLPVDQVAHRVLKMYCAEMGLSMIEVTNEAILGHVKEKTGEPIFQSLHNRAIAQLDLNIQQVS